MLRILLTILFLIPAFAHAGKVSTQGVWRGTLGAKSIVACFNGDSYASYYYLDYLQPIALTTRETDSLWHEAGDTGRWELNAPIDGLIVGTWTNPRTEKILPIKLSLVDGGDDKAACASSSYNLRLETTPKVEASKVIQFSPRRSYRKLEFAGQATIELFGPDPALSQINSALELDQSKEAVQSYFQQRREFLGRVGYPAVDQRNTEPTYWDASFTTIEFYLWVAGEGRSGISSEYRTWNTKTGKEIDIWQWIGASSKKPRLPPKLKKFLYRTVKKSPECGNDYRGRGQFKLTLTTAGMNIYEESWGDGCDDFFAISYQKLKPYLSPIGIQSVNSILQQK